MADRRPDVRALRGRLRGQTVYVLGNGPSVREHDLSVLRGRHVIGMNASPLLDREYGFQSEFYVVSDARFLNHPEKRACATSMLPRDVTRVLREELRAADAREWVDDTHYVKVLGKNGFSSDLRRGFYFGCTTAMLAIQLAAHAEAARIVLLGCDFRYPKNQPRFYKEDNPQDQDPFLSIQIWNIRNAFNELRKRGVEMIICTKSTNLTPYVPYMRLEETV